MEKNKLRRGRRASGPAQVASVATFLSRATAKLIDGWLWFSFVPDEGKEWLATRVKLEEYEKGTRVYLAGQDATKVFGVLDGAFRIFRTSASGAEIALEEAVTGTWFPHFLPGPPPVYMNSCVCKTAGRVLALSKGDLTKFAALWPSFYQGLYHELINRAELINGRFELLTLHSLNVRVAVYLLRLQRLRGRLEHGGTWWLEAFDSQSEVGARVGGARQRVNAVLREFQERGLIQFWRSGLRILDVQALAGEACSSGFDLETYLSGWQGTWKVAP